MRLSAFVVNKWTNDIMHLALWLFGVLFGLRGWLPFVQSDIVGVQLEMEILFTRVNRLMPIYCFYLGDVYPSSNNEHES